MKSNNNVLVNVLILIVGIVFIFMQSRENVINAIVIITGLLFVASGVINLIMTLSSRRSGGAGSGIAGTLACVAAVALGLWMALEPSSLVNIIVYILPDCSFWAVLITGIAMVIFAVNSFLEYAGSQSHDRGQRRLPDHQ